LHIDAVNADLALLEEKLSSHGLPPLHLSVIAVFGIVGFAWLALVHNRSRANSHLVLWFEGMGLLVLAALSSLSWSYAHRMSFDMMKLTVAPLFSLTLGMHSLFLVIHSLSTMDLEFIKLVDYVFIIEEVVKEVSPGIIQAHICSLMTLMLGATIRVPALAHLCEVAWHAEVFTFLVVVFAFPGLVSREVRRVKNDTVEQTPCIGRFLMASDHDGGDDAASTSLHRCMHCNAISAVRYGKCVRHRCTQLLVVFGTGLLCFVVYGSLQSGLQRNVNLSFADLIPSTLPQAQKAMSLYDAVGSSDVLLTFENIDVPSQQRRMLELYADIAAADSLAESTVPPYLTAFYEFVNMSAPHTLNTSWKHALYAPHGIATSEQSAFFSQYAEWLELSCTVDNIGSSMCAKWFGIDEFKHEMSNQTLSYISRSFFRFVQLDVGGRSGLPAIQDILDKSPLQGGVNLHTNKFSLDREASFPKSSAIRARAMLPDLDGRIQGGFYCCVATYALCSLWLTSIWYVKMISVFVYLLTILETYWLSATLVEFNAVSVVGLVLGLSQCPPFISHLANVYGMQLGAAEDRLDWSIDFVLPALVNSCASVTMLMLPLVLSPWHFMHKFLLLPFVISLLVSLSNACIVLPCLLALCNRYLAGESAHVRRCEKVRLMNWQKPGSHLMRLRQHSNSRIRLNAPMVEAVRSIKSGSSRRTLDERPQASVVDADVLPSLLTKEKLEEKGSGKAEHETV